MTKSHLFRPVALFVLASLLLTACAPKATATLPPIKKINPVTGFECPEPEPRMDVTSKEFNLFVWTEYVPLDMIACFELVYDLKVNRSDYSADEEMESRLASGVANYDLVQPSDYFVGSMIRNSEIQELDHSRLPNMVNIDPTWMNQHFDPGNKYTLPYLAGTDGIVVNSDRVKTMPKS